MQDQIATTTVQQEWMGETSKANDATPTIVVKECSCSFD